MDTNPFATSIGATMIRPFAIALAAAFSSLLGAQTFDPAVSAMRQEWATATANLQRAAEQVPETDFAFRPAATVRTFGQIIGHVVDAQFSVCALALAEKGVSDGRVEDAVTSKAELIKKLQESTAYCAKAYDQNISAIADRGEQSKRYAALAHNTAHNSEHYGNVVTYMRIKGLIPPSSQ